MNEQEQTYRHGYRAGVIELIEKLEPQLEPDLFRRLKHWAIYGAVERWASADPSKLVMSPEFPYIEGTPWKVVEN